MDVREKLTELLSKYFNIGDSYAYNLTRVKSAFSCGTVGLDDFEEFDDETVADVADYLIANGVTVQERGQWIYDFNLAGSNFYRCSVCDRQETILEKEDIYEYCPFCHCGAKMITQPPKGE